MLRKVSLSFTGMFMMFSAFAQTDSLPAPAPAPALTITGSADVYYKYDFLKNAGNGLTSFTSTHDQFALGMASVKFEHKTSKVDMVADLGFGKRAMDFAYNDNGILAAVKQLYISYSASEHVKFTAGSWATHVGYELVDPQLNRNYSMSYMFTNGPFTHTGLKADFTFGKSGLMVGVANPTDYRIVPDGVMNKKFILAQYSYAASDKFKAYLNFVGGKGTDTTKNFQVDLVLTSKLSDKFSIGYNGTINNSKFWITSSKSYTSSMSWWGSALYLNLDPKPNFGLTLRGEYFSDKYAIKLPAGGNILAATLSANIKVDGFTFIPEFRIDNSNVFNFANDKGVAKKSAPSLIIAAVYAF